MSEQCDLPPCRDVAVTQVRLVLEDTDTTVRTCARHAEWLENYSSEDEHVRVIGTAHVEEEDRDTVCTWCGLPPRGGAPAANDDGVYCHGPAISEPTCWQLATSEGRIVLAKFGDYRA
jgi:hypothetical protein